MDGREEDEHGGVDPPSGTKKLGAAKEGRKLKRDRETVKQCGADREGLVCRK